MDEQKWYYFTFGCGQENAGHYVRFFGTYESTRQTMIDKYGLQWAFQYSEEQWHEWVKRCRERGTIWMVETELK